MRPGQHKLPSDRHLPGLVMGHPETHVRAEKETHHGLAASTAAAASTASRCASVTSCTGYAS